MRKRGAAPATIGAEAVASPRRPGLPAFVVFFPRCVMKLWQVPAVGAAVVALALAGCGAVADKEPMPTDGPNQVVYSVPGMT